MARHSIDDLIRNDQRLHEIAARNSTPHHTRRCIERDWRIALEHQLGRRPVHRGLLLVHPITNRCSNAQEDREQPFETPQNGDDGFTLMIVGSCFDGTVGIVVDRLD